MAREYNLSNLPGYGVKKLKTTGHYSAATFEKVAGTKKWKHAGSGHTYNNIGDLLWEWAQTFPLVEIATPLEEAKDYFKDKALIQTSLRDDVEARRHATVIIQSVVGK